MSRRYGVDTELLIGAVCCCLGKGGGWTCVNGWWVHSVCLLPSYLYRHRMIRTGGSMGEELMGDELIYFEGGPHDAAAYEIETLLSKEALGMRVFEYQYTGERKTSPATGRVAKVFKHKSLIDGDRTPAPPASQPIPEPVTPERPQSGAGESPIIHKVPDQPSQPGAYATNSSNTAQNGHQTAAEAPSDAGGDDYPDEELTGEALAARRLALKPRVSRGALGDAAGLSASAVNGIENEIRKKIKREERLAMRRALARLEAEKAGARS